MQGLVLNYDNTNKEGIVRGDDGVRYGFHISSFKSVDNIKAGQRVDFEISGNTAVDIYIVKTSTCVTDIMDNAKTVVSETASSAKPVAIKAFKFILLASVVVGILTIIGILIYDAYDRKKEQEHQIRLEQERKQDIQKADEFMKIGQYGSAYDIYKSFVNVIYGQRVDINLLNKAAYCLFMMEKYQDAIELLVYERKNMIYDAVKRDNLNSQSYIIIGNAFLKLGDKVKAIENAKEACSRGDCSLSQKLGIK